MKLSHSERTSFRFCRRMWDLSYNKKFKPKITSDKLALGTAVHAFLEHYLTTSEVEQAKNKYHDSINKTLVEPDIAALGYAMVSGYPEWHQANDPIWLQRAEIPFEVPIPKTDHYFVGKVDGICRIKGALWVVEHKTASQVGDSYRDALELDEQVSGYMWAIEQSFGEPVCGVVYNVLRKADPTKKSKVPYYYRFMIQRSKEQLKAFEEDLIATATDMEKPLIYRNPNKDCFWRCAFKPVCYGDDFTNYITKEHKHEELGEDD